MEDSSGAEGLNRAEASFLAAAVRFGDAPDLVDAVESGPARALRARLDAVEPLGDEARRQCSAELRRVARVDLSRGDVPPIVLKDDERHFDALFRLDLEAFRRAAGDFGAFQLAELLRDKNRRKIARVASRFEPARRTVFLGALGCDRDCDRIVSLRIREVFVSFAEQLEAFGDRVARLGLYSIACAAGLRYRERIDRLADWLPEAVGDRLRRFYRLSYGSTRRGVGRRFRDGLEQFLDWRCETRTTE